VNLDFNRMTNPLGSTQTDHTQCLQAVNISGSFPSLQACTYGCGRNSSSRHTGTHHAAFFLCFSKDKISRTLVSQGTR
jgi:hypothetical protein